MKKIEVSPSVVTALKVCAQLAVKGGKCASHAEFLNESAKALGFQSYRALNALAKDPDPLQGLRLKQGTSFTLYFAQYCHEEGEDFLFSLSVDEQMIQKIKTAAQSATEMGSDVEIRVAELAARKGGSVSLVVGTKFIDVESVRCNKYDTEMFHSDAPVLISDLEALCKAVNTRQYRKVPEGFALLESNETGNWSFLVLDSRNLGDVSGAKSFGTHFINNTVLIDA